MRQWSVDEANAVLPWVHDVVGQLQELVAEMRARTVAVARVGRRNGHGAHAAAEHRPPDEVAAEIHEQLEALTAADVVVRDVDRGLLDFPAVTASGRPYLLCWLLGESEVTWWHWPEDGFAGRQPISALPE
ncbi:MAG: DUF2203 domain-containing protein [Acidimicrobiia bacterium]|nr:DUF2203 domain-containing protein [Acidimicrobiia bacterium]